MFQDLYLWFPSYAKVAGILSLVFAFLALVALIIFFITLYKKRKDKAISSEILPSDVEDIKKTLKAINTSQKLLVSRIFKDRKSNRKEKKQNNQD